MPLTRRALVASALLAPISAHARTAEPTVLDLRPGRLRLNPPPAPETDVWSINGQVPGPVLRVKRGEEVFTRLLNNLTEPVALHWQGVRIANGMDGAAGLTQAPVEPGGRMDLRFTAPDAGTYWYRPSAFPHGAEQKARGIYGLLIVDGPDDPPVDREFLVVIDDWRLDEGGQIRSPRVGDPDATDEGRIGSIVTVNSQAIPQALTAPPGARTTLVTSIFTRSAGAGLSSTSHSVICLSNCTSCSTARLRMATRNLLTLALSPQSVSVSAPTGSAAFGAVTARKTRITFRWNLALIQAA